MNQEQQVVLKLINSAVNGSVCEIPLDIRWQKVKDIAASQGVLGVCFDALELIPADKRPGRNELLDWFGHTFYQENQYRHNWKVARELSELFAAVGVKATVLKGRSIAQYYPKPEHRFSCDLDIFIPSNGTSFGEWEKACKLLEEKGVELVYEVYKEVEFTYKGLYVECHRYITPVRGNKTLLRFEQYLRNVLEESTGTCFEGTRLLCPPLTFILMLSIEHALGDLLHGNLTLKHVADWTVLRKQVIDRQEVEARCRDFGFDRFLRLMDDLADVVEGKNSLESLPSSHREVLDSMTALSLSATSRKSWFARRVSMFFEIIKNRRYYRRFGYCPMGSFLLSAVWTHFFDKEVRV